MRCTNSYPCTDRHVHADTEMQSSCSLLRYFAMGIHRSSSDDPLRHQRRRLLFQFWIPLRTREDSKNKLNITLSSLPVIIFPSPLIPLSCPLLLASLFLSSSLSVRIDLVLLPYTPALWFGSTLISLSLALSHKHIYRNVAFYYISSSLCHTHIYTNTHGHSNLIQQSLVFLNMAAKARYIYSLSFQPGSVSAYQPNRSHVSPK